MRRIAPKTRGLRAIALALSVADFPSPGPGKVENGGVDGLEKFSSLTVRAERVASLLFWRPLTLYAAPRREADGQSPL